MVLPPDAYGWQFDIHYGSKIQTCAPCQIQFVQDRKNQDSDFRTLIRMAKKWRNYAEIKPLKSFAIELIMAHVLATQGCDGSIEQRFRSFLLYITRSGLKDQISFPENTLPLGTFSDPVVILDPVYSFNNVTSRISETERQEIVAAAQEAWEAVKPDLLLGRCSLLHQGLADGPLIDDPKRFGLAFLDVAIKARDLTGSFRHHRLASTGRL